MLIRKLLEKLCDCKCHCAKCYHLECRYAECHGTFCKLLLSKNCYFFKAIHFFQAFNNQTSKRLDISERKHLGNFRKKNIWNKLRKLLETFFVIPLRIDISTATLLKSQILVFCSPFKMKFKKSCVRQGNIWVEFSTIELAV